MKEFFKKHAGLTVLCSVLLISLVALGQNVANYMEQGGARWVISSGGSLDVGTGGELDIESGGALKIAGTSVTASATELNQSYAQGSIADVSGSNSFVVIAPAAGDIDSIDCAISGDPGAAFELSATINGVAVTDSTVSVANGASAYEKDSATPSAANTVAVADTITVSSNGSASNAVTSYCVLTITR